MAKEKRRPHRVEMTEGKREIIRGLLSEYDIQSAQAILDARAKYPECSLADLYDETVMPPELRKAHQENDKAVMAAYVFPKDMTESEIVAELFKMYEKLTEGKQRKPLGLSNGEFRKERTKYLMTIKY